MIAFSTHCSSKVLSVVTREKRRNRTNQHSTERVRMEMSSSSAKVMRMELLCPNPYRLPIVLAVVFARVVINEGSNLAIFQSFCEVQNGFSVGS